MPYTLDGACVKKENGESVPGGCHETVEEAKKHLQALQANVNNSIVEMSMRISKASYNKSDLAPMKWAAIDSDTDSDLYDEQMSTELYQDFVNRIENNTPVPEEFQDAICEADWCGGMPYLSVAHYKAGTGRINVPGEPISVFVDGNRLKSKGILYNNDLGRKVFDALCDDLYKKKSDPEHRPVRISIGFLDLEHKHLPSPVGPEFVFTRSAIGQICPLCAQGVGGKIYTKGQLIHLAMTRVPVNPRTEMVAERSMGEEITTKRQDAESIIGELADGLEEKSIADGVLVVRSESEGDIEHCYDPNTGEWDDGCIKQVMDKYMPDIRNSIGVPVKSETMPKGLLDVVVAHIYKSNGYDVPVVEDAMEKSETVEKMVAGGESVPEKPFSHTQFGVTITGDGVNTVASPVPVKAEVEDSPEDKKEDEKEMKEMSDVEKSFAQLLDAMKSGSVEEVNKAFGSLGTSVEKEFKPEQKPVDMNDMAAIIKSAVESAVNPLRVEIATLKAQVGQKSDSVSTQGVVKSKALNLNFAGQKPEDVIQRAVAAPSQPARKLSQIEMIARKSTGAL